MDRERKNEWGKEEMRGKEEEWKNKRKTKRKSKKREEEK